MDLEDAQIDDNAHTGCYIFKLAAEHDEAEIDDRPKKRRKTTKSQSQSETIIGHGHDEYTWPALLAGEESKVAIRLRRQQFETEWKKYQAAIDEILNQVDETFVSDVLTYARQEEGSAQGQGQGRIRTGLLLSTPGHNAQRDLLQGWKSGRSTTSEQDAKELLVVLSPTHAPNLQTALKNVIRMAISQEGGMKAYTDFLVQHKTMIPMNFDLDLLQKYVQKHGIQRVLVSVSEVETFDTGILSELISMFSSWADRIPFVLLITISTTVELFESRLSRSTVSLLDADVFESRQSQTRLDPLSALYEAVQYREEAQVFFGPSVVGILAELADDQSTTAETFTRALKYVYMSHFFANPLSVLSSPSDFKISEHSALCQAIRNTRGFKIHCETLAKGDKAWRQRARELLLSDEALEAESMEAVRTGQHRLRASLAAFQTLKGLSCRLLNSQEYTSLETEAQLLAALPDLEQTDLFESIEQAIKEMDLPQFQAFLEDAASALEDVKLFESTQSSPTTTEKLETLSDIEKAVAVTATARGNADRTMGNDGSHNLTEAFLTILRRYIQSRTLPPKSETPQTPQIPGTSPFHDFMSEAFSHTLKSPLSSILHPRARYSLERALTRPADYLGCECCTPSATSSKPGGEVSERATLPPTSLLLSMLNEAGHVINVRDLWETFRDMVTPALAGKSKKGILTHGTRDREEEDDARSSASQDEEDQAGEEEEEDDNATSEAVERQALALFYRALADLRYLGFVKPSKRKPGVDCIAKTVWMGL
ncbi:hypothetical protein A1O1_05276 [Capronia coronata CBS 617.96]|uniref:Death domain-containing protein n=1 Tax=Capronia coronata CBS 617.96 TaxID=1182541 RepID=W9YGI2_9EURO|nr:uncharacterized protein A1O1_05276 [Capronia coronata CBS 617.96]EXJ88346.1 hypothetical protein A1O1_05276 [Capronia coronata CBS 617.96]